MSTPAPGGLPAPPEPEPRGNKAEGPPLRLAPPYFRVWAPLILGACLAVLAYITGRLLKYW